LLTARAGSKTGHVPQAPQPDLAFLTTAPSAKAFGVSSTDASKRPLTTNTNFALSQLPALRSLLADLRPRLASLESSDTGVDTVKAERREERRGYIEQRTKMNLERNGGAVAGNNAAVAGKRVEPEEVEALEKVANVFDAH
jgi:kinetochore protein Mis12/MTW1